MMMLTMAMAMVRLSELLLSLVVLLCGLRFRVISLEHCVYTGGGFAQVVMRMRMARDCVRRWC